MSEYDSDPELVRVMLVRDSFLFEPTYRRLGLKYMSTYARLLPATGDEANVRLLVSDGRLTFLLCQSELKIREISKPTGLFDFHSFVPTGSGNVTSRKVQRSDGRILPWTPRKNDLAAALMDSLQSKIRCGKLGRSWDPLVVEQRDFISIYLGTSRLTNVPNAQVSLLDLSRVEAPSQEELVQYNLDRYQQVPPTREETEKVVRVSLAELARVYGSAR